MNDRVGFDTDKYLKYQVKKLSKRLHLFERLYLEFGGKLLSDQHASRVLPGYRPAAKMELLKKLGEIDLFYCISAEDVAKGRIRGDSGLTYDLQTVKEIGEIISLGLSVSGVVISFFDSQPAALQLRRKLENLGIKTFIQKRIDGYPADMVKILQGYEKQPFIETKKKLVVVTGTGPGSGKMAYCLSQIYHERKSGLKSGFAKFETFPIWNLPLNHPVNVAYEASTADLQDINGVDPFHLKEYKIEAINYNRDIENFAILKNLLREITGEEYPFGYKSPTDMGVNMAFFGIISDKICRQAAKQEIIRRYFRYHKEKFEGKEKKETTDRIDQIMKNSKLKPEDRSVVLPARQAAKDAQKQGKGHANIFCGAALELKDGRIITGKNSSILHAESAAILNALKTLADIPDKIDLIAPNLLREISDMKSKLMNTNSPSLTVNETLIALAAASAVNPTAKEAMDKISLLRDCEMHVSLFTSMADGVYRQPSSNGDQVGLRILSINLTIDTNNG